ncbi:MAG: vitamin B12-dependent ribonucleotide reductase [Patescibacteria group bacterium]|nr:vitamin B12-dependent ribonucleotide reductase [Patescibacteria group bacterium]
MAIVQTGIKLVSKYFTKENEQVLDAVEWGKRRAYLFDSKENKALIDLEVEAPLDWSDTAVNIAAYKYLRKRGLSTPEGRETSVRQMIDRVSMAITKAGEDLGYFENLEESKVFYNELTHLLIHQKAAFNSPVWFNVGLYEKYGIDGAHDSNFYYYNQEAGKLENPVGIYHHPQCSACFIQKVDDSLDDIFDLVKRESRLFKYGSGTGSNFSVLRGAGEKLTNGGTSSGLLSFLKVFDAGAGATKSGGTTRRAAKMVVLDIDHPEIEDFIKWKAREEDKALALIQAGYDADFNGEAYHTISGQNANNSIRVTDEFMQAYLDDADWQTKLRTTGEVGQVYKAKDLMRMISESAWRCAEPGMQYDTTVNRWHTSKVSDRINASNPCSEFMFLDNSACNLASINLVKFLDKNGVFDVEAFRRAVDIFILAQEIIVDYAAYPTYEIAKNSHNFRPLGLGYANLGAYLMRLGLPYDSDKGRDMAAAITALMTGRAYSMSAKIAKRIGTFPEYKSNEQSMLKVIAMHKAAVDSLTGEENLINSAKEDWEIALNLGKEYGYRNAQTTLLAPTGTIGPMMDVDTTGVEPDFALVKYKKLAGGGGYSIVNQSVESALKHLGYPVDQIEQIKQYILEEGAIEDAPNMKEEHLPIFDCANKCGNGVRFIKPKAHIDIMAAVQPFLSGAISKTVNMPEETTVEEIENIYLDAWKKGLKAIAIYRNNSKSSQPLSSGKDTKTGAFSQVSAQKIELPRTRSGLTHKVIINGQHKIFITANQFENGELGEIFINAGKEGSVVSGLLSAIARLCSKMLQEGASAEAIVKSFLNLRFDPWGMTDNPDIPMAKSITDYIGKWIGMNFLPLDRQIALGIINGSNGNGVKTNGDLDLVPPTTSVEGMEESEKKVVKPSKDQPVLSLGAEPDKKMAEYDMRYAPTCPTCGAFMIRSGTCFACPECATTTGCS